MTGETFPVAGTLDDGRRYSVLEELEVVTLLGLRFWDAVRDDQIREGLVVRAWPAGAGRPVVEAFRTRSGVYAFRHLPGLRDAERPSSAPAEAATSPPTLRPFVVSVVDPRRRFLPVAFTVELPLAERGVFLTAPPDAGSPAGPANAPGVYLFSSPVRERSPELAVVRGELVDATTGKPAGHALLRLEVAGGGVHFSLSDGGGRFAVLLPFPTLVGRLGSLFGSPADPGSPPARPIGERTWEVDLRVAWEPERLDPVGGTAEPEYREILSQAEAGVLLDAASPGSPPVAAWSGVLDFGGEVVARSTGRSRLFIVPGGSSP